MPPWVRQYWIASDTEERPFSRRQRAEVYRYAKNEVIQTAAFGTLEDDGDDCFDATLVYAIQLASEP